MKNRKIPSEEIQRRKRIGYNFKRLREDAGFRTQQELADHLGLKSRNYIGKIESGHSPFAGRAERRFAKFFNVDMSEFLKPLPGEYTDNNDLQSLQAIARQLSPDLLKKLVRMGIVLRGEAGESRREEALSNEFNKIPRKRKRQGKAA